MTTDTKGFLLAVAIVVALMAAVMIAAQTELDVPCLPECGMVTEGGTNA